MTILRGTRVSSFTGLRNRAWASALAGAITIGAAVPAAAQSVAAVSNSANFTFTGFQQVAVPGMTTPLVAKPANLRLVVLFSAECTVQAPVGLSNAWLDVDIVMRNAAGEMVMTLPPTEGPGDALCSSHPNARLDGWVNATIVARVPFDVPAGNYSFEVRARLNAGATTGWLGQRSLVVLR